MPFIQIFPDNRGGGRKRNPPGGRLAPDGQLTINHAAAELLDDPDLVLLDYAAGSPPDLFAFRLRRATASDRAAWTLTGGGNTQRRTKLALFIKANPTYAGSYAAVLDHGALILYQGAPPPQSAQWRPLYPAASATRGRAPQTLPAKLLPSGAFNLGGPLIHALGDPAYILIFADPVAVAFRLEPSVAGAPGAWRLSGEGDSQRRLTLTTFIKQHPQLAGEYTFTKAAHGLLLKKK